MVMFDWASPDATDKETDVDTKKVDRVMKVFEALKPEEQRAAFTRMEEIIWGDADPVEGDMPAEGDMPPALGWTGWAPMTEGLPMIDDQATTGSPFEALQNRLQDI